MVETLLDLTGQIALVTGASGGIGCAIARKLTKAGATVILHCSDDIGKLSTLSNELGKAKCVACDLSCEINVKSMIKELEEQGILPNLLVNNAGVQTTASIENASEEVWKGINAVNLNGPYALTKHLSNAWVKQRRAGAIVNIASIEGIDPAQGHAHYAASKAALLMFTKASALELGKHNIRVNAIAPGLISRTGIEADWPEGVKRWQNSAPLKRLGTGEDVANAALFLLSSAAVWISGNTLVVDGGMSTKNRW